MTAPATQAERFEADKQGNITKKTTVKEIILINTTNKSQSSISQNKTKEQMENERKRQLINQRYSECLAALYNAVPKDDSTTPILNGKPIDETQYQEI